MTETAVIKKSKYRTGFCLQGWCEGTKPTSYSGRPAPTCKFAFGGCACKCHAEIDRMFEIAGLPREVQDLSGYEPLPSRFVMPDRLALAEERLRADARSKVAPSPDAVRVAGHAFEPTPTGIRAPGQLEYTVLSELQAWLDQTFSWLPATPKRLSEVIGDKNPPAPSSGAIHAIFVRWQSMGFCKFQNRPAAFQGFVNEGTVEELDLLKKARDRDRTKNAIESRKPNQRIGRTK